MQLTELGLVYQGQHPQPYGEVGKVDGRASGGAILLVQFGSCSNPIGQGHDGY